MRPGKNNPVENSGPSSCDSTSSPALADSSQSFCREDIEKLARGTGTSLFGGSLGKAVAFLTQLLLAWLLGIEKFGLYNLGLAVVTVSITVSRLGLSVGGLRFVSLYKETSASKLKGIVFSAIGISLLSSSMVGAIVYFAASAIARSLFHKPDLIQALRPFCFSIPAVTVMNILSSLLQGFHTTKFTVLMKDFIQPWTNVLLILAFAYGGLELSGAVYAYSLSHMIAMAAGLTFLKELSPQIFQRRVKPAYQTMDLLSYSIPMLFVGFLQYFLTWTDTLMLGILASTSDVGIYRAASQVPLVMTLFLGATNSIYAPLAADLFEKKQLQRLSSALKAATRWVTYTTVPIFIFLVFSRKEIMMVFGKEYVETGSILLAILCFGQLANCITGGVGLTLTMTGKQYLELANSLGLILGYILLNVILISRYGVIGSAIATSTATLVINFMRMMEVYIFYRMIPFSKTSLSILLPSFLSILLMLIIRFDYNYIITLLVRGFIIGLIFMVLYIMVKIPNEDKYLIIAARDRILNMVLRRRTLNS